MLNPITVGPCHGLGRHVPVLVIALFCWSSPADLALRRRARPVVEEGMQVDLLIGNLGGPPAWSGWTTRPCSCVTATGAHRPPSPHYDGDWQAGEPETWLDGLDFPHDVALLRRTVVSEAGRLRSFPSATARRRATGRCSWTASPREPSDQRRQRPSKRDPCLALGFHVQRV